MARTPAGTAAQSSPIEGRAIVFGAPRSGTTFLMEVLDTLGEAECVTGNLFPTALLHLAATPQPPATREVLERGLRGGLRDYLASSAYGSRAAALRKWWTASRDPRDLRGALAGRRRERVLVYKEPFISFCPAVVWDALPDARFVYLVRDGRDVADSLLRKYDVLADSRLADVESNETPIVRRSGELLVPWWVESGAEQAFVEADQYVRAIWMWSAMASRAQDFLDRPDVKASGRVLTVRYEDLVADPLGQGSALIDFLGMRMGPRTRRALGDGHQRSLGVYRRRPAATIRHAEEIGGAELRRAGYEVAAPSVVATAGP
ncbi:MAG TPA: sulfotransferase [Solirubrobacterales bacterium]|nr:sulfotransferase [Solirubrobacterales bacterium]